MTEKRMRAGLVLPDATLRRQFADGITAEYPDIDLVVLDPLRPGTVPEQARDLEVLFSFGQFLNDDLFNLSSLRWVQALGSGTDGISDRPTLRADVLITSARGVHTVCVSEAAFGLMISLARDIPLLVRAQDERRWAAGPANLLYGRTVGILGVGLIAEGMAARCHAFGMRVEGISGRGDVRGFDRIHPYEAMREAVAAFDYFVLLAPLTDRTRNIVDAAILAAMKPGACLINVARGGVVDESALIEGLRSGRPAAAALDVFATEPLSPDSLLWGLPNVLISPHVAGQHQDYASHVMPILRQNIAAYRTGRAADLINVIREPVVHQGKACDS